MVSHELLVVADYDGSKTLDEIEFASIPIWVRVANLPMGLMNRSTAQAIGDEIGAFMELEAEAEQDEVLAGRFLHVKMRLDIRKPLMRGVTLDLGEGEEGRWCPLSYEYLLEFCYCYGIIGHTDKSCQMNVGKKAVKAFGRELRYIPLKRRPRGDGGRLGAWRSSGQGVSGRVGGGSSGTWLGSQSSGGRSRSDAPSWRKSPERIAWKEQVKGDEEEGHCLMKNAGKEGSPDLSAKHQLFLLAVSEEGKKGVAGDVNSTMQGMHMSNSSGKEGGQYDGSGGGI